MLWHLQHHALGIFCMGSERLSCIFPSLELVLFGISRAFSEESLSDKLKCLMILFFLSNIKVNLSVSTFCNMGGKYFAFTFKAFKVLKIISLDRLKYVIFLLRF